MNTFKDALERFVQGPAKGNKAEAARRLGITRPEVHAYLGGRRPRADKVARLSETLRKTMAEGPIAEEAAPRERGVADPGTPTLAFQLIRYLYDLLEDADARSRR